MTDDTYVEESEPWQKVGSLAEFKASARANIDALEVQTIAQVRAMFAEQRARLEREIVALSIDLERQRNEGRGSPGLAAH